MPLTLYMFSGSNAVLTAQLMLRHKRLAYRQVNFWPGAHMIGLGALGFKAMTVPSMRCDGRRVEGTRQISRALDEIEPADPLFDADPERRAAIEAAELWGEGFQNAVRRVFYAVARRDPRVFADIVVAERSEPARSILRATAPFLVRAASLRHAAVDAAAQVDVAALPAHLDQIDAWIEQGLLDGPELNAADFQIAANLAALLLSQDAVPYIADRPAARLARRVAPNYTGTVGASLPEGMIPRTLPAQWLP